MAPASGADGSTRIRVVVVDDHDLFRTGLVWLLKSQESVEVVGQASSGKAGVRLATELRPDVVLMDLRMPDMDGLAATRELIASQPTARVVALTVASSDEAVGEAVQAGACGFLVKETPIEDVVMAIHAAARGAAWLSPRAADAVLGHLRQGHRETDEAFTPPDPLSPRELDVLTLVARGMENAEIAQALQISPRTAKNHVSSIITKLGVTNRVQAAIYAVRSGFG